MCQTRKIEMAKNININNDLEFKLLFIIIYIFENLFACFVWIVV